MKFEIERDKKAEPTRGLLVVIAIVSCQTAE
jgi:hypothetical protein